MRFSEPSEALHAGSVFRGGLGSIEPEKKLSPILSGEEKKKKVKQNVNLSAFHKPQAVGDETGGSDNLKPGLIPLLRLISKLDLCGC